MPAKRPEKKIPKYESDSYVFGFNDCIDAYSTYLREALPTEDEVAKILRDSKAFIECNDIEDANAMIIKHTNMNAAAISQLYKERLLKQENANGMEK